ncbi:MAG: heparinase II/III family protein [Planctomycetota bacterium]|nr:heparinase II/III family protein [Planctomycetota bacterium]
MPKASPAAPPTVNAAIVRKDPHPKRPPDPAALVPWTNAVCRRPHVLATPEELDELRSRLERPVEAEMLRRLRERVELGRTKDRLPKKGETIADRTFTQWQGPAALLYALTGDPQALAFARDATLALARANAGDASHDLSAAQALASLAWSYDLLHDQWSGAERREILDFAREFGTGFFSLTATPVCYWAGILLQNHCHVAWTGIGLAGMGFYGEIDQAAEWARWAHRTYRTIAWLQPPDGTNLEGPSYGAYGIERRLMYYESAKRCIGEDLYNKADARAAQWFLHQTLPDPKPFRNALRWGDTPEHFDWHGPAHSLFALAKRFKDPVAQAQALRFWRRKVGLARNLLFLDLLYYDPKVPEGNLEEQPGSRHFEDLDLVCARSSWKEDATVVSFLCGPYQGHRVMRVGSGDLGGAHCHADTASLQAYSRGEVLLADPGYEHFKRTEHHNTVLVDGHGQLGEGTKWFNVNRVLHFNGTAEVLAYRDEPAATAWVGEAARIYVPEAGLLRFRRHVYYARPDLLVVYDDLEAQEPRVFTQLWHAESAFAAQPDGRWGFVQGGAALSLRALAVGGQDGDLKVTARHQDLPDMSEPGRSQYELRVESPRVKAWRFATAIAFGDAASGVPGLSAHANGAEVSIESGPGAPRTVRFALDGSEAPTA